MSKSNDNPPGTTPNKDITWGELQELKWKKAGLQTVPAANRMSLSSKNSGCSDAIWICIGAASLVDHGPRLLAGNYGEVAFSVSTTPEVEVGDISNLSDERVIKEFIVLNEKLLLKYWADELLPNHLKDEKVRKDFLNSFQPIGKYP